MQVYGLTSWMDYFNAETCDIWEGNVTTNTPPKKHMCSLGFHNTKNGGDIEEVRVYNDLA